MVELVFIHGVNTRREVDSGKYDAEVAARHAAFRQYSLHDVTLNFHDSYWGGEAAQPAPGYLPPEEATPLLFDIDRPQGPPLENTNVLLLAARENYGAAVNTLATLLADTSERPADPELAGRLADHLMDHDPTGGRMRAPHWLDSAEVKTDRQFIDRLSAEIAPMVATDEVEALDTVTDTLKDIAKAITDAALKAASYPMALAARHLSPKLAIFLGDVFVYLDEGEARIAIRKILRDDLIAAARNAKDRKCPLIVMGHSMGANILYDMIAETSDGTPSDEVIAIERELKFPLKIDLFASVGTQIGLFETLGVFREKRSIAPMPTRIERWWHVYNRMDVLSFAAAAYFEGIEEYSVDTNAHILDAHSAYFTSPVFHKRLRHRLIEAGLIAP